MGVQVVGPSLPALRQFAARLLTTPSWVWRSYGALDIDRSSVWLAYAAPVSWMLDQCVETCLLARWRQRTHHSFPRPLLQCAIPGCTGYSNLGICICTRCQAGKKLATNKCIDVRALSVAVLAATGATIFWQPTHLPVCAAVRQAPLHRLSR